MGGVAATANVGSRWLLRHAVSYEAAVALAYLVGMVTAFTLMKLFVFERANGSTRGQLVRFALVNGASFTQVWLVSVGLARFVLPQIGLAWYPETVAHIIGVGSPVITSYLLHKRYSFRQAVSHANAPGL